MIKKTIVSGLHVSGGENRGRVIQVEAVMQPLRSGQDLNGACIRMGTSVEDAMRQLTFSQQESAAVANQEGQILGTLTFRSLAEAMVNLQVKQETR